MKSRNQLIQSIISTKTRQVVRYVIQPGIIENVVNDEFNKVLSDTLNKILQQEANEKLGRKPYERIENIVQRNGFKPTPIHGFGGGIRLKRPVVRKGTLKLPLLEALKQSGRDIIATLAAAFWLKGTSTRNTSKILNASLGSKLSPTSISRITNALEPEILDWENRTMPNDIIYVFLDALYLPVHWRKTSIENPGFTVKQALLCALGIDSKGVTHFLGHILGDRETLESWTSLLDNLIKRGLDQSTIRLVISDEHKAIIGAVRNRLGVKHQYCVFHKMKNVQVRVPSRDRKAFMADFRDIFWAESREDSMKAVGRLQAKWHERYPRIVEQVLANLDNFLAFMDEPKERWKNLRTSNRIERFNRELRSRLNPAGTIHSELELSKITWSVSLAQEEGWRHHRAFKTPKEVTALNKAA